MLSTATKNIEFAVRSGTTREEYCRILRYRKIQILIDISSVKINFTLSFISYAASDMHDFSYNLPVKSMTNGWLSGFLVLSTRTADFLLYSQSGWLQPSQPSGQSLPHGQASIHCWSLRIHSLKQVLKYWLYKLNTYNIEFEAFSE